MLGFSTLRSQSPAAQALADRSAQTVLQEKRHENHFVFGELILPVKIWARKAHVHVHEQNYSAQS